MKLTDSLVLLGLVALPLSTSWVDANAAQEARPRPAVWRSRQSDDNAVAKSIEKNVAKLGSNDAKARKSAFDALAKVGEKARTALAEAQKSSDAEIRFSATQLLDRLDAAKTARAHGESSATGRLRETPLERDDAAAATNDSDDSDDETQGTDDDGRQANRQLQRRLPSLFNDDRLRELHERTLKRIEELFDGENPFAPFGRFEPQDGAPELAPGSSFSRVMEQDGVTEKLSVVVDESGRAKPKPPSCHLPAGRQIGRASCRERV